MTAYTTMHTPALRALALTLLPAALACALATTAHSDDGADARPGAVGTPAPQAAPAAADTPARIQPASEVLPPPAPANAPPASTGSTPTDAPPPTVGGIRFQFKGQSWDQILDYFSRTTGLPVVRETDSPKGQVDYISARAYTLPEALTTLNQLLQTQGVMLRVEADKLYLQKLVDMKRENIPTYIQTLPSEVTDDTIVTLMLPLRTARVGPIAERLGALVGSYGSVTPLEAQNTLILVETAGQVRRMVKLLESIDQAEPDAEVRFFPVRYAKATTLIASLSALIGQRQIEYVIGPDGKKTKIEESRMEGLSMTADERTNAIVARGTRPRLEQLRDVIQLLDVPGQGEAGGGVAGAPAPVVRSVRTVMLRGATPSEAKKRLDELYQGLPKEVKPTVLAMDEVGKIAIVGPSQSVAEGAALIEALDGERRAPGSPRRDPDEDPHVVSLIPLRNADAASVLPQVRALQTPMQQKVVVIAPGPDGRSLVVSALSSEVEQVRRITEILDQTGRMERRVQVLKVSAAAPAEALATARRIYAAEQDSRNPANALEIETGADGRTLTVAGTQAAITRFTEALAMAERAAVVERTTRVFDLKYAKPSAVAPQLAAMAQQILAPKDGTTFTPPVVEPMDALRQVQVTATAAEMPRLATLVDTLDRAERTGRMVSVRQAKAAEIAPMVRELLTRMHTDSPGSVGEPATIEPIEQTNALWVVGEPAQLAAVESLVRELDTVGPGELPPMRLVQVRAADALQLAQLLSNRYDQRPADARRQAPVRVEADAATNTLIVTAHESVFPEIRDFVEQVNRADDKSATARETVVIPLRTGRAMEVAAALDKLYPQPPVPLDARGRPLPHLQKQKDVFVTADAATNTVIVECPADRKASFQALVEQLDRIELPPQAEVRTWRLDRGDPEKIAAAVRALAQSGALASTSGSGRKGVEVTVQVEAASRTLIVTGDEAAFTKVDKVVQDLQSVPQSGLRTFVLQGGRTEQVSELLRQVLVSRAKREFPGGDALVEVTADRRTATLIVSAPETLMAVAEQLVRQLDGAPALAGAERTEVRVLPLTFAEAGQLAPALQQAAAAMPSPVTNEPMKVQITPATGSNSLIVTGLPADIEAVAKLIEPLDKGGTSDTAQVRTIVLKHARAETLAPLVERLLADRVMLSLRDMPASVRQEYLRRGIDRAPVRVAADTRLNAVVVSGPQAVLEVAEQMVGQLDADATDPASRQSVHVLTMRDGDATEVAGMLTGMFQDDRSGDPAPVIRANAAANSLVVRASDEQFAQIERLVQQVDRAAVSAGREMRTVSLDPSRADASELARLLERTLKREGQVGAEVITVEELLKRAAPPAGAAPGAEGTAPRSAAPARERADWRMAAIAAGVIAQAAPASAAPSSNQPAASAQPANAAPAPAAPASDDEDITIAVDTATNSLVIVGSRRAVERAQRLANQAQTVMPTAGSVVRVVQLPHGVDVMALRDVVAQTVQTLSPVGGRPGDLTRRASVVADPVGGTLVLSAPSPDMPLLLDTVATIVANARAAEPALKPVLRTFALQQARAPKLADTLRNLFMSRRGANPLSAPQFASDERTNTLMVTAAPSALVEIEELVQRLDAASPKSELQVQSFELKNALAEDVQWTVRQLLQQRGDAQGLRVDSDRATNRLLVAGTAEQIAGARTLLDELDKPAASASTTDFVSLKHAEAPKVAEALEYFYGPYAANAQTPARRAVRVVTDLATNSLVISSPESEWAGIRAMLEKLDTPEYDSTLQLKVFALKHAQALSVAAAINTAFKGDPQERQAVQTGPDGRPVRVAPNYLVRNENWVSAVAEPQTNAVIVSASRQNLRKIETIVQELDGEQAAQMPAPRLIPVKEGGSATMLANALRTVFAPEGGSGARGARAARIIPDETAGVVIVRADDGDWKQIRELAETLQGMRPDPGSSLFMVELKHLSAEAAAQIVQTLGMNGQGAPDARGRVVKGAVRVAPVPGRNALAVAALPEDRAIVADLIKSVDIEPQFAQAEGQMVRLKVASATAVAASLQRMLDSAAAPGAQGLAKALQEQVRRLRIHRDGLLTPDLTLDLTKPIRLGADEKTNSILITGAAENVAAAAELVTMLDDVPVTGAVTMRIFPMANLPAADFARVVRELFAQGKALGKLPGAELQGIPEGEVGRALLDSVAITVIDRTNTVVVAGREESVALVEVMQKRLDSGTQTGWVEPRIIQLRHAAAADLALVLDAVLVQGQTNLPDAGPMQKQVARLRTVQQRENGSPERVIESDVFTPMSRMVIRADETTNSLILVSTEANLATMEQLVRMLDVEAASPAASVRTYPLERAGATATAQRLATFFEQQAQAKAIRPEDRVRVLPDERTNSLIVSTSGKSFAIVEELLRQLDREVPADLRELKTIQLANASANRVAPLVQQLMDARLDRLRSVEPRAADLQRVTVLADERSNTLLVAGGADAFDVVKGVVEQLDSLESGEVAPLHVLPMQRGNLDRVAQSINQIMERRYADMPQTVAKRARPLVMTDPRSNCLLIAATDADFKDIQGLVAKIEEQPTDPAVGVNIVPVQGVRVETIATQLQGIMRDRAQSLGETARPSDRVTIGSDLATNCLIVASSPENLEIVKGLVDSLRAAGADSVGGREFQIVQLNKSRATDLVQMLDSMYIREENRRRGADSVRAIADPRINAVVLSGAGADISSLQRLIANLEEAKPNQVVEIKYLRLQYANVLEITSLIDSVLSGNNLGGRGQQQATVVRYLKQAVGLPDETTEMEVNAAVRQAISLTPDVRSNTIIVRAPRDSMDLIQRMIRDLDHDDASAQNVRVIKVQHAEAESIAEILTNLFRLDRRGNLYVLKPRDVPAVAGEEGGVGATAAPGRGTTIAGLELTMVPDEKQELSITVDPRSNSLLVSGTPNYLNAVERVVRELDTDQLTTRDEQVYKLKNASATEVASTLTRFVDGERAKMVEAYGGNRPALASRLLDQQVTVVGDQKSNSVLLTGSQRYMERLKGIIRELDVEPPQVLIQVLLAEVTLENSEDIGLQFARVNVGDYSAAGGFGLDKSGFAANAPRPPGLLALAPALFAGLGVPNIAIGGPDFDLLLNALASQNRVQLLSNPSVMVANNTEGMIQVGQTIRVPDAVTVSSAGQQSAVRAEEIGVILTVTPSINPDGFVKMVVEPEISRLSKQTVDISETFRSPIIERRRANTTVTVRDGETIVIGGLINDRYERTDKKVPFLGDIPLIGLAFRQKSEATSKTELLIVLRPYVVRTPARMNELTQDAVKRMTLQPGLKEQILKGNLKGLQGRFNEEGDLVDPIGAPSETPAEDGDAPMKPLPDEGPEPPAAPAPARPGAPSARGARSEPGVSPASFAPSAPLAPSAPSRGSAVAQLSAWPFAPGTDHCDFEGVEARCSAWQRVPRNLALPRARSETRRAMRPVAEGRVRA